MEQVVLHLPIMCLISFDFFRYLKSIVETILIYKHFVKLTSEQPVAKQELVDFWMDFLVEATKTDVTVVRFPVSTLHLTLRTFMFCFLYLKNILHL